MNLTPPRQQKLTAYLVAHPVLDAVYRFNQRLCCLLLKKHRTRRQCETLVPRFLGAVQLGNTLRAWSEEIVVMWRYTRNNEIT